MNGNIEARVQARQLSICKQGVKQAIQRDLSGRAQLRVARQSTVASA